MLSVSKAKELIAIAKTEPLFVVQQASRKMEGTSDLAKPYVFLAAAIALRALGRYDLSRRTAEEAERRALQYCNYLIAGRAAHVLSLALSDLADFKGALRSNTRAGETFLSGEEILWFYRSLFDRGVVLWKMGRLEDSDLCFFKALEHLPDSEKYAARQGLAINSCDRGQYPAAQEHLSKIELSKLSAFDQTKMKWLSGRVQYGCGFTEEGLDLYQEAIEELIRFCPISAALAGCELCQNLLDSKKEYLVPNVVKKLIPIAESLDAETPHAAAAIWELILAERRGETVSKAKVVAAVQTVSRVQMHFSQP